MTAHAAERTVDGFVLLLIKTLNKLLDLFGAMIEFFLALEKTLASVAKVDVLVVGLLVDVRVLLELVVDAVQRLFQLRRRFSRELFAVRQEAEAIQAPGSCACCFRAWKCTWHAVFNKKTIVNNVGGRWDIYETVTMITNKTYLIQELLGLRPGRLPTPFYF